MGPARVDLNTCSRQHHSFGIPGTMLSGRQHDCLSKALLAWPAGLTAWRGGLTWPASAVCLPALTGTGCAVYLLMTTCNTPSRDVNYMHIYA